MGLGQIFLTRVWSGQPFMVWVWKFSPKMSIFFIFFPLDQKTISLGRVKGRLASYLLRVKSKLGTGQGPPLVVTHKNYSKSLLHHDERIFTFKKLYQKKGSWFLSSFHCIFFSKKFMKTMKVIFHKIYRKENFFWRISKGFRLPLQLFGIAIYFVHSLDFLKILKSRVFAKKSSDFLPSLWALDLLKKRQERRRGRNFHLKNLWFHILKYLKTKWNKTLINFYGDFFCKN